MYKLIETKLQKTILLIGGVIISSILINEGYSSRYEALGVFILVGTLLLCFKDYHPKFHLKIATFLKKHRTISAIIIIALFLIIVSIFYIINSKDLFTVSPIPEIKERGLPELPKLPKMPKLP